MKNTFKYFLSYLNGHKASLSTFVLLIVLYDFMMYVFNQPSSIIIYTTTIILVVSFIIGLIIFVKNYRRYTELVYLKNMVKNNSVNLPTSNNPNEKLLNEMVDYLQNDRAKISYEKDNIISDMNLYYSIWAHQIKTPISAMNLQMQTEDLPQYKELSNQLFKIEQYVDMALNYIRAESMSGDMVIENSDLDKVIKETIKKFSKSFIRKKIALDYKDLNVKVLTDRKWLGFVLEQLISNALKYTKEGKISIYMEKDNVLVIEDTGIGIDPTDIPRLFEKGFTGYNGRENNKSTGIGLYLSRKILSKLSHTISIESQIGVGTKVKIEFIS